MKKFVLIAAVLLVACGVGTVALRNNNSTPAEGETAEQYQPAKVERGPIRLEVSSTGTVTSNLDVEIKCKASGQIINLPFDISNQVNKGDLLLELDPVDEDRNVRQAEVSLTSSQAKLAQARQDLSIAEQTLKNDTRDAQAALVSAEASAKDKKDKAERMTSLLEKKYASPEEEESAKAEAVQAQASRDQAVVRVDALKVQEAQLELLRQDIQLAECQVESNQIAVDEAKQRLKETKVYAPIPGVVSARLVEIGQIISSPTANVGGGTSLMTISDLSQVFVLASVDESDIGLIKVGQPVTVTVDAFPKDKFEGKVVRVATKGDSTSNVVTFEVKIEVLGDAKNKLRPEMTADAVIVTADKTNALLVPSEALVVEGPQKFLLVAAGAGEPPTRVPVEVGIDDDTHIEILSGIEENADILIPQNQADKVWTRNKEKEDKGPPPMMMMGGPPKR